MHTLRSRMLEMLMASVGRHQALLDLDRCLDYYCCEWGMQGQRVSLRKVNHISLTKSWNSIICKLALPTRKTCDSASSEYRWHQWCASWHCWPIADALSNTAINEVYLYKKNGSGQKLNLNFFDKELKTWLTANSPCLPFHPRLALVWSIDGFFGLSASIAGFLQLLWLILLWIRDAGGLPNLRKVGFRFFIKKPKLCMLETSKCCWLSSKAIGTPNICQHKRCMSEK